METGIFRKAYELSPYSAILSRNKTYIFCASHQLSSYKRRRRYVELVPLLLKKILLISMAEHPELNSGSFALLILFVLFSSSLLTGTIHGETTLSGEKYRVVRCAEQLSYLSFCSHYFGGCIRRIYFLSGSGCYR